MRNNATCHSNRANYAYGKCRSCYEKERYFKLKTKTTRHWGAKAKCHPERPHFGLGLCQKCCKAHGRFRDWEKNQTSLRRWRHGFTPEDELRYHTQEYCDWCDHPFLEKETKHIDHDHACCGKGKRGCGRCLRGFVHAKCNILAIGYYEWLERTFGEINPQLSAYRLRFPRRKFRD